MKWYATLNKPELNPPSWVFGPVWAVMYTLIFISICLFIGKKTDKSKITGYTLFAIQMLLNLSWTPVFFDLHEITAAFVIIVLLVIFLIMTIVAFYRISKIAAILLIPYLLWVMFATYLNYSFMVLN